MRDFSWKYFALTGDVDAFLLYKDVDQLSKSDEPGVDEETQLVSDMESAPSI
ncbi:YqzL family protein [Paenibacillus sepulcri]|uniref:YqzL family protein n=1 Tax=Paenibacillus sepulcri TaxID=359917 RepID=A0ABS7C6B2_9BACL|nr:YqzL family protein [Paenibacillus sepulcri]